MGITSSCCGGDKFSRRALEACIGDPDVFVAYMEQYAVPIDYCFRLTADDAVDVPLAQLVAERGDVASLKYLLQWHELDMSWLTGLPGSQRNAFINRLSPEVCAALFIKMLNEQNMVFAILLGIRAGEQLTPWFLFQSDLENWHINPLLEECLDLGGPRIELAERLLSGCGKSLVRVQQFHHLKECFPKGRGDSAVAKQLLALLLADRDKPVGSGPLRIGFDVAHSLAIVYAVVYRCPELLKQALTAWLPSYWSITNIAMPGLLMSTEVADVVAEYKACGDLAVNHWLSHPLQHAVLVGSVTMLEGLKAATEDHGVTPLMEAVAAKRPLSTPLAELDFATINQQDQWGLTALHYAVWSPNATAEDVQLLLDKGANPNLQDVNGRTALMQAPADKLKVLVESGHCDLGVKDNWGQAAMFFPLGLEELAYWLSQDGLPLPAHDDNDHSLLMRFVAQGRSLLEIGRAPNGTHFLNDQIAIVNAAHESVLSVSILKCHTDNIDFCLTAAARGFSLEDREKFYYSGLLAAITSGHVAAVKMMLTRLTSPAEVQALLQKKDHLGRNLLHIAAMNNQFEILSLLRNHWLAVSASSPTAEAMGAGAGAGAVAGAAVAAGSAVDPILAMEDKRGLNYLDYVLKSLADVGGERHGAAMVDKCKVEWLDDVDLHLCQGDDTALGLAAWSMSPRWLNAVLAHFERKGRLADSYQCFDADGVTPLDVAEKMSDRMSDCMQVKKPTSYGAWLDSVQREQRARKAYVKNMSLKGTLSNVEPVFPENEAVTDGAAKPVSAAAVTVAMADDGDMKATEVKRDDLSAEGGATDATIEADVPRLVEAGIFSDKTNGTSTVVWGGLAEDANGQNEVVAAGDATGRWGNVFYNAAHLERRPPEHGAAL